VPIFAKPSGTILKKAVLGDIVEAGQARGVLGGTHGSDGILQVEQLARAECDRTQIIELTVGHADHAGAGNAVDGEFGGHPDAGNPHAFGRVAGKNSGGIEFVRCRHRCLKVESAGSGR